jgi:hypothetical protein
VGWAQAESESVWQRVVAWVSSDWSHHPWEVFCGSFSRDSDRLHPLVAQRHRHLQGDDDLPLPLDAAPLSGSALDRRGSLAYPLAPPPLQAPVRHFDDCHSGDHLLSLQRLWNDPKEECRQRQQERKRQMASWNQRDSSPMTSFSSEEIGLQQER